MYLNIPNVSSLAVTTPTTNSLCFFPVVPTTTEKQRELGERFNKKK